MENKKPKGLDNLIRFSPKTVDPQLSLVEEEANLTDLGYPFMFKARNNYVVLKEWIMNNRQLVQEKLHRHGAVLFRNFNMPSVHSFRDVVNMYGKEIMEYTLGAARRSKVIDNIYLSTHHPADENLEMHNEMSYTDNWPVQIIFYCNVAPAQGGETPIADSRRIWQLLKPSTKEKFSEHGVMYIRQLGGLLGGLTWQQVFKTDNKEDVERSCTQNAIQYEWLEDGVLKMKWVLPATRTHVLTGETVWFNHAFFFNSIMLNRNVHATLKPEEMPFVAYYGDGTEISEEELQDISDAYEQTRRAFPWQKGDLLLVDNLLMAHGRSPYSGDREILVAMFKRIID